jgi:hypothetical protein
MGVRTALTGFLTLNTTTEYLSRVAAVNLLAGVWNFANPLQTYTI